MKCIDIAGENVSFYYLDDASKSVSIPLSPEDEDAIRFHIEKYKQSGKLESYRNVNGRNIEVTCFWSILYD